MSMPITNVYLDDELFEFVKENKSKIIQEALRQYKEKTDQALCSDERSR